MIVNYTEYPLSDQVNRFLTAVYGWMMCALLLSAGTAYYVSTVPAWQMYIKTNPYLLFTLLIAQLVLVIVLSLFILRMNLVTAIGTFLLYATLLGVTLSVIFEVYTEVSIFQTFIVTAGMFGVMAVYGYVTRSDLSRMGNISFMMLVGLVIGMFVNIFLRSQAMDFVLSGIGVIVFTLLTAYDMQRLKRLGQQLFAEQEVMAKIAVLGALTLYLDFVNLFLFLLRFMGRRRDR